MASPQREPVNSAEAEDLTGRTIGRFAIRELIGRGGMGEVYRADDSKLRRPVALKRLKRQLRDDPAHRERILNEAQRASAIDSRNIASVHDVLEDEGEVFLVMEYVEGEILRRRLRDRGPVPPDEFLLIAIQCANALMAAHQKGVIHRDLKPDNIMLTLDGTVKVLDFGLAKRLPLLDEKYETASVGPSGEYVGTPGYMAPEVLMGGEVDHRADIFSLGVVFYEALTGNHPFRSDRLIITADRVLHDQPARLTGSKPLPPALEQVIQRMLAKRPEERYQSTDALLRDLRSVQQGKPIRRPVRVRTFAFAAVVLAAVIAAGLFWPRSAKAVFAERDWVLIADFDNTAGEPVFDKALNEALTIALQQSSYVNTLPRGRLVEALHRMQRDDATAVDEALGRELCQRENVRVLLAGSISRAGSAYQMRVRALDPPSGRVLFAEEQRFTRKEELFERVDALAAGVRKQLGESLPRIQKSSTPLDKVTTRSVEALQLYSRAADDIARSKVDSAAARLHAALALDPDFAMAHYLMANVYQTSGSRAKEAQELESAYQLRARVSDRERYLIEADYEGVHGRFERTAERLELLISLYPDDATALYQLAVAHFEMGKLEEGIGELQRVVQLNPHDAAAYGGLVLRLAYTNADQEALQVYAQAAGKGVHTARLEWGRGMALLGAARVPEARKVLQAIENETAYGAVARIYLARADLLEGRFAAAGERLRADLRLDLKSGNRSSELVRRYLLARAYLMLGERQSAKEQLERIVAGGEPRGLQAPRLQGAGVVYAQMGDLGSARRVLHRLKVLSAEIPDPYSQACALLVEAEIALAEGRVGPALESFQKGLALFPTASAKSGLARAYARQQNWQASAQAWQQFLDSKGEILRDDFAADWVLAQLELARVYRQLGNSEQARSHYQAFVRSWADGDDLAVRRQALRELQEIDHQ